MPTVTKVGKVWSWLLAKIRRSESSPKSGPPYTSLPPIPVPKGRSKAGYSIVLMSDSGTSRQLELTPWRIRVAALALAGVVCTSVALVVAASGSLSGRGRSAQDTPDLESLKSLQEEMKKKDLALAVLEKRLKETQEASNSLAISPKMSAGPTSKSTLQAAESELKDDGPLTSLQDSLKSKKPAPTRTASREDGDATAPESNADPAPPGSSAATGSEASLQSELSDSVSRTPLINFNAQEVTAASEGPNSGTLSFRLIKDQPDVRFSGYLFVVVEMADQRGENKTYVYPKDTRLGEEDLPTDYKEGEGLSFKENARVELPYGDIRTSAALSRVSIVLYAESGRIVFQRSFDKKEVKLMGARNTHAEGVGARQKSGEKRRAL
jgi:hypothetical protein